MKKITLSIVAIGLACFTAFGQMTEGVVSFDMTMSSDDEAMQAQLDMMGVSEMIFTFKDKSYKSELTNMFMKQKTVFNEKENLGYMFSEIMGKKTAVKMTPEELEEKKEKDSKLTDNSKVTYFEEYKEIAGYKCQKVAVATEESEIIMFVTKDIKTNSESQFTPKNVEGFALEVTSPMNRGGNQMTMTMTAKKVNKTIKDSDPFSLAVPKGYKEMTFDEFSNEMKNMQRGN